MVKAIINKINFINKKIDIRFFQLIRKRILNKKIIEYLFGSELLF